MPSESVEHSVSLDKLKDEHHQADLRLQELDRHLSLSAEEQVEVARLKKRKLQLKDEIRRLGPRG